MEVGIRELRNNLAAIMTEVDRGVEVTITHHGKARAKLVAVREKPETTLERGIREGWITVTPAFYDKRRDRRPRRLLPPGAGRVMLDAIREDREDDR
jgi:prevent-host-death family protein